jgi:hypothetical protein
MKALAASISIMPAPNSLTSRTGSVPNPRCEQPGLERIGSDLLDPDLLPPDLDQMAAVDLAAGFSGEKVAPRACRTSP